MNPRTCRSLNYDKKICIVYCVSDRNRLEIVSNDGSVPPDGAGSSKTSITRSESSARLPTCIASDSKRKKKHADTFKELL